MRINKSLITYQPASGAGSGTVTSVALSAPTGFSVSGSPIVSSGTLALAFTTGYGIPPLMTGNSGKFLTTNGTTMSWSNIAGTDITGAAISTSNDTNILISASGNTTNALLRTMTLTAGWTGQLSVGRGGTGAATLTGVLIGNGTSAVTAITGGPNQILRVNSSATGYEFYTASFLTNPMTLNYDMIYQSSGVPTRLPGNTTTTKQFLSSVGNGTDATSIAWSALATSDIPSAALTSTNDTNVQITLGGTPNTSLIRAVSLTMGWTGQLAVGRGGSGASTLTGVLVGNGTSAFTAVVGTAGQFLRRNTANTAYEFRTLQGGDIAGSELTFSNDTNVTMGLSGTPASALLQPVSINLGWTGQLAVGRGGTGASTLTGVLIGNGTSAVTTITGTAGQILRRNTGNTAYEFWSANYLVNPMTLEGSIIYATTGGTPAELFANSTGTRKYLSQINGTAPTWEAITGFLTGSGSINFVPIWTSSSALGNSPLSITGSEANFGSNKLVAGNTSAPNGSIMLQDNYTNGHFGNVGTMFSGGNFMLGYGVTPSTSSSTAFLSSVFISGVPLPRYANVLGTDVVWYAGADQSVAIGSSVTMSERMRLTNAGNLQITTGNLQLNTTTFISWGGAYGANIPSIQGTSGSSPGFGFYAAGSTSGLTVAFNGNGSLKFYNYQSPTSFTGTATAGLAVTATGDLITTALSKVATEGNYTPTWTGISNVDSVTAFECRWMRIGDTLTISGKVAINATVDNTATSASFTLPTSASNPQAGYMNGVGVQEGGGASGSILGYGFNTGIFELLPLVDTTINYSFIFTYRIV